MKPNDKDELLDDLLTGQRTQDFRQVSLQRGMAYAKTYRRRRKLGRLLGATIPILFLAFGVWTYRPGAPKTRPVASISPGVPTVAPSKVRLINDDDLLALFPHRPLALIGSAGHRKLVFLDQPNPGSPQ